jgi:hypothetical protein
MHPIAPFPFITIYDGDPHTPPMEKDFQTLTCALSFAQKYAAQYPGYIEVRDVWGTLRWAVWRGEDGQARVEPVCVVDKMDTVTILAKEEQHG